MTQRMASASLGKKSRFQYVKESRFDLTAQHACQYHMAIAIVSKPNSQRDEHLKECNQRLCTSLITTSHLAAGLEGGFVSTYAKPACERTAYGSLMAVSLPCNRQQAK